MSSSSPAGTIHVFHFGVGNVGARVVHEALLPVSTPAEKISGYRLTKSRPTFSYLGFASRDTLFLSFPLYFGDASGGSEEVPVPQLERGNTAAVAREVRRKAKLPAEEAAPVGTVFQYPSDAAHLRRLALALRRLAEDVAGRRGGSSTEMVAVVDTGPPGTPEGTLKFLAFLRECSGAGDGTKLLGNAEGPEESDKSNHHGVVFALANKKPLASATDFTLFAQMFKERRIGCRACLGAGLPVVPELRRLVEMDVATAECSLNGGLVAVRGCFSGSLGTLFGQLEDNIAALPNDDEHQVASTQPLVFSQLVQRAWNEGKTEPDPRVDLSGADVAAKIFIIARLCGLPIVQIQGRQSFCTGSLEEHVGVVLPDFIETFVSLEGIVPRVERSSSKEAASVSDFLTIEMPKLDAKMQTQFEEAAQKGEKLKFVGEVRLVGWDSIPRSTVCSRTELLPMASLVDTEQNPHSGEPASTFGRSVKSSSTPGADMINGPRDSFGEATSSALYECTVGIRNLDKNSFLGGLTGSGKGIEFVFANGRVIQVRGGGAGGSNAAADVILDLLDMYEHRATLFGQRGKS